MRLLILFATFSLASILAAQQQPPPELKLPEGLIADVDVEYSRVGERVAMDIIRPASAGRGRVRAGDLPARERG